jgi:phospholipid/cholesterol/gamma-HCH transport system substrate-binding protein
MVRRLLSSSAITALTMPRRLRWSHLRFGIASFAAVVIVAASILTFGRVGSLRGKTFTLFVRTEEARGVIRGTDVWLNGQRVGVVRNVGFQPGTSTSKDRVVLRLAVLDRAREQIRADSRTQIRSGGSLISSPVVYLHSGTIRARELSEGDTLYSEPSLDVETAGSKTAGAAREFPAILANIRVLSSQLKSVESPFGTLRGDVMPRVSMVRLNASRFVDRLSSIAGIIGLAFSDTSEIARRAQHAMASVDSLRAFLDSGQGSLGRFRRDSTLQREIAQLRDEVSVIRALATNTSGTLGRFRADSAYRQSLNSAFQQLDSLFLDLRKHPLRYIAF